MKLTLREFLLIAGLVILGVVLLTRESCNRAKLSEKENINLALQDKVQYGVNKFGDYASRMIIMSDKIDDLTSINAGNDSTLFMLQQQLKYFDKKLKGGDNVTVFYDSSHVHSTTNNYYVNGDSSTRISKFQDKWINYTITSKKDSTTLDLHTTDGYSVAILHERRKLFKKFNNKGDSIFFKKMVPVAVVTSFSPYSSVKDVRSYSVTIPKIPKWGLSLQGGVGMVATFNGQVYPGVHLGIGVHYILIPFGKTR